jgi:hypothetical protein
MTTLQYKLNTVNQAVGGTTSIVASGNITVHTVSFPKATVGTTLFYGSGNVLGATFPIGSIGCLVLDACFPNGLSVVTGSVNDFVLVTTDTP